MHGVSLDPHTDKSPTQLVLTAASSHALGFLPQLYLNQ
jgi:hypothetical protein